MPAAFEWLLHGQGLEHETAAHRSYPWYSVLWLTGVDYFSTLGYQPGIALLAAGALAPVATLVLVVVTLTCALPVYAQVARRSHAGQGSIALLENLLKGWSGKTLILILLGFAATDFVITMTLSAADAAEHAVHNPLLNPYLGDHNILVTLLLLALLAAVFLRGFTEAIGVAALVALPYLGLNLVVLARGAVEIVRHPETWLAWQSALQARGQWSDVLLAAVIVFPSLALGLSGFETGVSVMPLIDGEKETQAEGPPHRRIAATRKLLLAAALIMSFLLLASSLVTSLLVPAAAYQKGGPANGRAIAYLAHQMLGHAFGTVYDISTILILWFAGASAMAGLMHLIPRYLPRFGMAPRWVAYSRPLVLVLFGIDVAVRLVFRADVNAQGGAYATGVLVLMLSAAVAAAIALWRERTRVWSAFSWFVAAVFTFTLLDNIHARPDGLLVASVFIVFTLAVGIVSRSWRSTELRVSGIRFTDSQSEELWSEIQGRKVNLAPVRSLDPEIRSRKLDEIHTSYRLDGPVAFLSVGLVDNTSEFLSDLHIQVRREGDVYLIEVTRALAIANAIAYMSELLDPVRLFLGLSRKNLVSQAFLYLLLGQGETGLMVYTILVRYWEWTPEDDVRPMVYLMSD